MNILAAQPVLPALPPPQAPADAGPRTQKARGIVALARYHAPDLVPPFEVHSAKVVDPNRLIGFFSRPCPMRPRHGFVDSRKVSTIEEGCALIRETLDADPDAEIVTMPLIDAAFSGIWTTGLLTIGRGHDGATSGSAAWSVPALGNLVTEFTATEAGVNENPYVEILWPDKDDTYRLVQLRDGPALPRTENYIPHPVEVKEVILATGDLLIWEETMRKASAGTVVHHPGGSLASHYAIHAVLNRIPVVISREPKPGEFLRVEGEVARVSANIQSLRAGFYLASRLRVSYQDAAQVMLAGCHHISVWAGRYDTLLGLALGFAYRLTVAAALGEMRHAPGETRRRDEIQCRNDVYDAFWDTNYLPATRQAFEGALRAFHQMVWRRSYGGAKWFYFARWAATVHNHLLDGHAEGALQALNQLVHCAHNTGWAFNKFVDNDLLTITARNPVQVLVDCVPILDRARRILMGREAMFEHCFERGRIRVAVPTGEPNEEVFEDEERDREWYERRADEPMGRQRSRRVRDRVRRTLARRGVPEADILF